MSVTLDDHRACFNYKHHDEEAFSYCIRRFKAAREILLPHLGGPILVDNSMEESHPVHVKIEDN